MMETLSFEAAGRMLDSGRNDPFLRQLRETEENRLHITLCGAVTAPEAAHLTGDDAVDAVLAHCAPLLPDTAATMEIVFEDYILAGVCCASSGQPACRNTDSATPSSARSMTVNRLPCTKGK